MATTAMDYENANGERFEEDTTRYERDRSASPRHDGRHRSMSPGRDRGDRDRDRGDRGDRGDRDRDRDERSGPKDDGSSKGDDGAINPGSNLFVTGIHPKLTEAEVTRLFEKYGDVEKCQIMRDPHSKESRGFGFVKMVTSDMADAAKEGLQAEVIEGRTLSIEKARRSRPRTPTPGKYFGPPKRELRPLDRFERFGGRGDRGDRGDGRDRRDGRDDRRDRGGDEPYNYRGRYAPPQEYPDRFQRGGGGGSYPPERYLRGGAYRDEERHSRRNPYDDPRERYQSDRRGGRPPRDLVPAAAAGYGDSGPRSEGREHYGGTR